MPTNIKVNPVLLKWARNRADLDISGLAQALRIKPSNIENWERTGEISLKQLERVAKKAHIPVGYLFLDTPPNETLPINDFRKVSPSQHEQKPSPNLLDTVLYSQFRQDWFEKKQIENESEPLSFINTASLDSQPEAIAESIKRVLDINENTFTSLNTLDETLRLFVEKIEHAGILVMRSGIVGSNTRRILDVNEFRGFTINNNYSPLIFVNNNDSKSAQIFTLAHELAHVWLGQSGVSNLSFDENNRIETFCNKIASEVLIPNNIFKALWNNDRDPMNEAIRLARLYKVSSAVMLIKARQNDFISQQHFSRLFEHERENYHHRNNRSSGGNFYYTQAVRLSKKFIRAVVSDTYEGNTTYVEAFQLLGIKKSSVFTRLAEMTIT